MAVNRQANLLGQQRIDVPHLRQVESAVCYDFDAVGLLVTGGVPCVVSGFDVVNYATAPNSSVYGLTIKVANARIVHPLASNSGSFFQVPNDRPDEILNNANGKIQGSWTPNATNYLGVDLRKTADPSTTATVRFLTTNPNVETDNRVPLARTMDYVFTISTTPFSVSPSICPLLIVITDATNAIITIQDARTLLFSNDSGGDSPSSLNPFGWPGGRNRANQALSYIAGDRSIKSLRQWLNATMTRIQEIAGGEYWYSLTADRNVRLAQNGAFTSTGEAFEWISNNLHWKGLKFLFDNSTSYINEIADQLNDSVGLTDLQDGECIYVDLDRSLNHTVSGNTALSAQKAVLATLGGSTTPGQRWVIATRIGTKIYVRDQSYPVGSSFKVATTTVLGAIKTTLDVNTYDPIAATVVPANGSSYGAVTGTGLTRANSVGTSLFTAGDLTVGFGSALGDQNINIRTTDNYNTTVVGNGNSPYLTIRSGGYMGNPLISGNPLIKNIPFDIENTCHYENTKAWSQQCITVMPTSPANGTIKAFAKQTKTWHESIKCISVDFVGSSWTYDGTAKTITRGTNTTFVADGITPGVNDRVLIATTDCGYNGIWKVTSNPLGNSGPPILTRADDWGGPNSPSVGGYGFEAFDGAAAKITQGNTYANSYWVLRAEPINNAITFNPSISDIWVQTDTQTADQYCIMFSSGNYVAIATGPTYTVA